jgi:hypothetical protein
LKLNVLKNKELKIRSLFIKKKNNASKIYFYDLFTFFFLENIRKTTFKEVIFREK